jgi:uncharacterized protein (TIGR03067 family)
VLSGVVLADEKSLKELEGTYSVLTMEKDGKVAEKEKLDALKFTFKGDEVTIVSTYKGDKEEKRAKLKADNSKTPHTIDFTPTDGEAKGKTFPGIYKIEKGELTIVFVEKGDRPTEFKAEGDAMLMRLKKDDKK